MEKPQKRSESEQAELDRRNDRARQDALADLLLLRRRLADEGETELLQKISQCQEPINLRCVQCETTTAVKLTCKRKWCPCCARQLAARRSAELAFIVERMRWPLFVTLTMRNVEDLSSGGVRTLRRAFGKLRHRKLWKSRVVGGIAAVEVTNIGNGWHPHLHAVIDCKWLAIKTPPPQKGDSKEELKQKYQSAAAELERVWAKILHQPTASVKVKRADRSTIAKEVVKYTVKGEDLCSCETPVGDLIRALDSCRLLTTFGRAHGQKVSDVRAMAKAAAQKESDEIRAGMEPRCVCGCEDWLPDRGLRLSDFFATSHGPMQFSRAA